MDGDKENVLKNEGRKHCFMKSCFEYLSKPFGELDRFEKNY
jgi:hypothetical protein